MYRIVNPTYTPFRYSEIPFWPEIYKVKLKILYLVKAAVYQ